MLYAAQQTKLLRLDASRALEPSGNFKNYILDILLGPSGAQTVRPSQTNKHLETLNCMS